MKERRFKTGFAAGGNKFDPVFTPTVRNILEILRIYPATLDIQLEAMTTLQWRISHITKQDNYELEHFAGSAYVNTLYSALDRNLCQDLCFLQWVIKIVKSKILHCKKASSNNDMSLLQYVKNTIN